MNTIHKKKMNLKILSAMEKVRDKIEADGFKIYTYLVDVSDREDVYKAADQVKADLGPIDILINNAGVVCGQPLLDIPDYMIEKTYKVNILSHYWVLALISILLISIIN